MTKKNNKCTDINKYKFKKKKKKKSSGDNLKFNQVFVTTARCVCML